MNRQYYFRDATYEIMSMAARAKLVGDTELVKALYIQARLLLLIVIGD